MDKLGMENNISETTTKSTGECKDLLEKYLGSLGVTGEKASAEREQYLAQKLEQATRKVWSLVLASKIARQATIRRGSELPAAIMASLGNGSRQPTFAGEEDAIAQIIKADVDRIVLEAVVKDTVREGAGAAAALEEAFRRMLQVRNRFVRVNLPLVVSVARRLRRSGMPFVDRIQEGNMGLLKAVHRFDYTRGYRFSTYAHWWIRQGIERAVDNTGKHVRVPVRTLIQRRELEKQRQALVNLNGREPTRMELTTALGWDVERVDEILAAGEGALISFEGSSDDDTAFAPAESIADETQPRIDEELCRRELRERVAGFMNTLSITEREVLKRRYGLESDTTETLQDAALALKVSPETVRQAQLRAIKKIRSACKRSGIATLFASPARASV